MAAPAMKPERRRNPRTKLATLVYINFEGNNGGIVLDLSDDGLCFHAFAPVQHGTELSFFLSGSGNRIEAVGVLAWTDEHRKTGGLRFNELGPDARREIRALIEQPAKPLVRGTELAAPVPSSQAPSGHPANEVPATAPGVRNDLLRIRTPLRWGDFSRGLAAGLLIALVVAAGFSLDARRRELGSFLIHLGERLEVSPQRAPASSVASAPAPPDRASPAAGTETGRRQVGLLASVPAKPEASAATSPTSARRIESLLLPPAVTVQPHVRSSLESTTPAPAIAGPVAQVLPSSSETPASAPAPPTDSALSQVASVASQPISGTTQPASAEIPAAGSASRIVAKAADQPGENDNAEDVVEVNSGVPLGKYFEVGKFRDEFAANQIERNLTDLHFRAVVLPKSLLWMKSYQVLVGPFRDAQDADVARRSLQSEGYKPHSLAKRSRQLTLVASWRNPQDLSEKDTDNFIVSWEAYSAQATVNYVTNGKTSGTAVGRWVKLADRSAYSAIVYSTGDPGKRTLLSIQFYGMKQAVMLNSADRSIVF